MTMHIGVIECICLPFISAALTALHEFGHFFMARRQGWTVTDIVIGAGPKASVASIGETRMWISVFFFWYGSCTWEEPDNMSYKSKISVLVGGPMVSLFVCLFSFGSAFLSRQLLLYYAGYFALCQFMYTLLPIKYYRGYPSDGLQIYRLIRTELLSSKADRS